MDSQTLIGFTRGLGSFDRTKALGLAVVALSLASCNYERPPVKEIRVIEFGTYQRAEGSRIVTAPGTVMGKMQAYSQPPTLIQSTSEIHASVGTSFGMFVEPLSDIAALGVPLTIRCAHPKQVDPVSGRSSVVDEWPCLGKAGSTTYIGFTFHYPWELVPGRWDLSGFGRIQAHGRTFLYRYLGTLGRTVATARIRVWSLNHG